MRHSDKVINKALVTISDKDRTFIRRYNSSPRQQTVVVFASVCPIYNILICPNCLLWTHPSKGFY